MNEPKLNYTKNTKADIYYGGGYKSYKLRQLHRLYYKSYWVSGITIPLLSKKELDDDDLKNITDSEELFRARILKGKNYYNNNRKRFPNKWTKNNIKLYGNQPPKPLTQKEVARLIMIRRSYEKSNTE